MVDIDTLLKFFLALFVAVNPIGNVAFYMALTNNMPIKQKRKTALTCFITVVLTLIISILIGKNLLQAFGISISSFRIGAGIALLLTGLSMLRSPAQDPNEQKKTEEEHHNKNVGVVPLAIPIFAGPAAITVCIASTENVSGYMDEISLSLIAIIISIITWLAMRFSVVISRALGQSGIDVATRVLGLIMTTLAIEIIATGLKALFPVMS